MADSSPPDFTPVPLRGRRDGWTPERQLRFVALLAEGLGASAAARAVGMTKQTAYALRGRPGAEGFRAAWYIAVDQAREASVAAAPARPSLYQRAVVGVTKPIIYRGRQVGEIRCYDKRALAIMLGRALRRKRDGRRG